MTKYSGLEIAVIGMSCRFPDADNISEYWNNLQNGEDCISTLTNAGLLAEKESPALLNNKQYVKANAYLKSKGSFDSAFFGYRNEEASLMNPQTRVYHECCWEAIEDSGYSLDANKHRVGIFAAGAANVPWILHAVADNKDGRVDDFTAMHLRDVNFLSSTIAYKFNLKGPAVMVQTACSSSLVAVHEACNSLLLGECNLALAGGVNIQHYSQKGYVYKEGAILSQDGKCRPFSGDSSGTVVGEGAGVVVLKRLKDAIKDNDHIYAIIKGTAVNNDGNNKIGYTAPSVNGQVEVLQKAQKVANVAPETISYVEAHGTATSLGDPVEVEALNIAFNNNPNKHCALGSVKSNIGHADTAAGIAGFIKVVLALKNKKIPATLHFESPNPKIDFNSGPFYVNNELIEWNDSQNPLRAGVSSFGIGGTNAHVILEQAPVAAASTARKGGKLLTISGKTKKSLDRNTVALQKYLAETPNSNMDEVAYTLQVGRNRFEHRRVLTCETAEDAILKIANEDYQYFKGNTIREDLQNTVFLFPGQGTQYSNMCKGLYNSNGTFKQTIDNCLSIAASYSNRDFKAVLFPEDGAKTDATAINDTAFAQPLLFAVEYTLAKMLESWGVKPDYMIGHSVGEYVAACISGVFSLQDAIKLVVRRGELMGSVPHGDMLSVTMNHVELRPLLVEYQGINIAVINAETSVVVAGAADAIAQLEKQLTAQGTQAKKLHTSHAFHSFMMDPILASFEQEINSVTINEPQIPYISNLTGELVTYDQINKASYWSGHLRNTVQFSKGAETLLSLGDACFIELGPGRTLSNYVADNAKKSEKHNLINTVRQSKQIIDDWQYLLEKLGDFWLKGLKINWESFYSESAVKKVALPAYSFEQTPYVTDFNLDELLNTSGLLNGSEADYKDKGIYASDWKKSASPNQANELDKKNTSFIVFSGNETFGSSVIEQLTASGQRVIEVRHGNEFDASAKNVLTLNYNNENDLALLWEYLGKNQIAVGNIIHCASLTDKAELVSFETMERRMADHYSQFALFGKSIALWNPATTIKITLVTNHLAKVTAYDRVDPFKAAIQAPAAIMPSEIENIYCQIIDIPYTPEIPLLPENYTQLVINEIFYDTEDLMVAYRYGERWTKHYEPVISNSKIKSGITLSDYGTYLVTGGFGGMVLVLHRILRIVIAQTLFYCIGRFFQKDLIGITGW